MTKKYILETDDVKLVIPFFRARRHLSKNELCKRIGTNRPTWDRIEKNPACLPAKLFDGLSRELGEDFIDFYMDNKMYKE